MGELKAKQEEAAKGAQNFGTQSVEAFNAVGNAIIAAGVATALKEISEAYMECVRTAGDFEYAMSNVEALSGATGDEMAELSALAKELGATTKFTAEESADAMGYMAMAGWDATEMLNGMDGVLQLAAASGEDLAMVSDIVTDNLSAFGLTAADTAHFSDVLAAAATSSNTSVSIMGETFKNCASIAGALGYSVEDVAVAVGLMANSGVKGSVAGTALKNTFNGLLEGVTLTGNAFGEYEYSAIKADGTMKSFGSTIDELRGYFDQMTEAERVNNAMAIAGARGYNGLLAILNATEEDYGSLTATINDCSGAAQRMADIKLDNMNGELVLMQSAWDGLKMSIGEQFTPVMRELYAVAADLFGGISKFISQHPALVKAIAAFVAVVGTAVVALTAYAAVVKVIQALNLASLFTVAGPIMLAVGAVSALTAGIVALVSAANEGVPSVKELTEAAREMGETMEDAKSAYQETATATMAAAGVADTYISKLEEMGDYASLSTEEQQQYHNTLALLCQVVPELADHIDLETNSIEGGTEALRANTEAWRQNAMQQAYQDQLTAMYESYSAVLIEAEQNSIGLTKAQADLDTANQKLTDTYARMDELWADAQEQADAYYEEYGWYADATSFLTDEYWDLQDSIYDTNDEIRIAEKSIKNYNKAMEEDAEAVAEAEAEIASAEEAVQSLMAATETATGVSEEAAQQTAELNGAIESVTSRMAELTEAYNEAYGAAYSSISGQYALWDEAAAVVETSASTINSALESQITYWQDYNANLQSLTDRAGDIEGLSDMIASFADGSEESVNAIAGMASASDEDLAAMVANWQELQAQQEEASGSIADLKTDFTATMDELQEELAADIEAMDLGTEAAESGKATIQGFIAGAVAMQPQVEAAYSRIAQAAIDAIDAKLDIHSPSRVMQEKADMTWAGYIKETEALEPDLQKAMSEAIGAGVDAASADSYQIMAFAPQLLSALSGMTAGGALSAIDGGYGGGIQLQVIFEIAGNATPETVEALRDYGDDFAERVLAVIEEADADRRRVTI